MRADLFIALSAFVVACFSQRSPYAGRQPVGYPALETTSTTVDPLGNRFGAPVSTEPLPIEALGDRDLVNRLAKLPLDKQPFWYINWRALQDKRNNQETYQQRPNAFLEDLARTQAQNQASNQIQARNQNQV